MDALSSLLDGFTVALQPSNLLWVLVGVLVGTVIGVLPGLGPAATIAVLLPLTYNLGPEPAIIMLAGIYYGSMYGGTITSVLLRLPGEAASVVTTFDGHAMARQGRAGPALGIAAIGSFIGGTVAVVGLTLVAPAMAEVAVRFGPPEFTALALLGLLLITLLGTGSVAKSLAAAGVGLLLATVGQDPVDGSARLTFGSINLLAGLDFVAIAMGLFGIGEVLYNLERRGDGQSLAATVGRVLPSRDDWRRSRAPIGRGSVLGFLVGVLPGGGGVLSSLLSYAMEKRVARQPDRFGRGAIEGVAGPETANNASSASAFIPLLTLGIPANPVLAMIFGALLLQGITPGPQLINQHPAVFWGVIASMYIGNAILLILNLPLVGVFVRVLRVRGGILAAVTILVTLTGVYSVNNNPFDLLVAIAFGALGYLMRKSGYSPGPLVLAFVLGPLLERSVRESLLLSAGDFSIFVTRPASAALLALAVLLVTGTTVAAARRRRRHAAIPPTPTPESESGSESVSGSGSGSGSGPESEPGSGSGLEPVSVFGSGPGSESGSESASMTASGSGSGSGSAPGSGSESESGSETADQPAAPSSESAEPSHLRES